jgi:hypothetical protein
MVRKTKNLGDASILTGRETNNGDAKEEVKNRNTIYVLGCGIYNIRVYVAAEWYI